MYPTPPSLVFHTSRAKTLALASANLPAIFVIGLVAISAVVGGGGMPGSVILAVSLAAMLAILVYAEGRLIGRLVRPGALVLTYEGLTLTDRRMISLRWVEVGEASARQLRGARSSIEVIDVPLIGTDRLALRIPVDDFNESAVTLLTAISAARSGGPLPVLPTRPAGLAAAAIAAVMIASVAALLASFGLSIWNVAIH